MTRENIDFDVKQLLEQMELDSGEIENRKAFLALTQSDLERLTALDETLEETHRQFLDDFYEHLKSFPELQQLLESQQLISRLKQSQLDYFSGLTSGDYEMDYVKNRLKVGSTHRRVGLKPHWYLSAYQWFLKRWHEELLESDQDRRHIAQQFSSLLKITFFDISLAIDTYIAADRRQLQSVEQSFHDIIESSPDGIVIHRHGEILYVNPMLADLLKIDSTDGAVGRSIYEFIHPNQHSTVQRGLRELRENNEPSSPVDSTLLGTDDSEIEVEITSVTVDFQGSPGIVSLIRDVTDRNRWRERMMRLDRMAAAGTLAAGVGHEINNPLSYVSSNVSFALRQVQKSEQFIDELRTVLADRLEQKEVDAIVDQIGLEQTGSKLEETREALVDAREGGERIEAIVRQLGFLSEDHDSTGCVYDLKPLLESALEMASNEIRHRGRLVTDFDDIPPVQGEENKLHQVFLNLLINAAHAIEDGPIRDHRVRCSSRYDDPWVVVEIEDTGKGIAPEHIDQIFDPFFTTKDVGQGTGLGLHISQTIVQSYGGHIEVDSEVGEGSVFRVLLPVCDVSDPDCPLEEPTQTAPPDKSKVLVIDDEQMVCQMVRRLLEKKHRVTVATGAQQALEELQRRDDFDVILCDVMMPEMTGMELYRMIEDRFPHLVDRIVLMTGGAFTPKARDFLERVDNPVIAKPFDNERLRSLIADFATGSNSSK